MRISDWSSDVCSSDLQIPRLAVTGDLVMDVTTRHVGEGEVDPNIGSRDRTGHPWRNEGISQGALKGQAWHNDDRWLGAAGARSVVDRLGQRYIGIYISCDDEGFARLQGHIVDHLPRRRGGVFGHAARLPHQAVSRPMVPNMRSI